MLPALLLVAATLLAACSSAPVRDRNTSPRNDQSMLRGWMNCTDAGCGRGFISAYSTFQFLQVDDRLQKNTPVVITSPGRHWVEAYYSWGAGIMTGIGNYRNYGFEIELLPGYTYQVEDAPSGCIVPMRRHWVSPRTLHITEISPSGNRASHSIRAMEYCTPESKSPGSCKKDGDCASGVCTPFGGETGFGLCGELR
ncbi:hypothetical protein EV700_0358 [Fluviicoccus keumensis]|uniref:Uncharacterized protein n=1 Tax=Fluviicoccus keumensis TaxID=1435465 RepID=A0A4Q7ZA10_9GAMM|nr:hypothetical protein [Fluviicoccus keumensis]RZU47397.1 hypothetical protein EV700_0358 [Fluviicoccus keumensis]